MPNTKITITDAKGNKAVVTEEALQAERVMLQFDNGSIVDVETALLLRESPTHYLMPYMASDTSSVQDVSTADASAAADRSKLSTADANVLTVAEEVVHIDKVERSSETVRISKSVVEDVITVNESLKYEDIKVERRPVGEYVTEAAKPRIEGDITIVPVYEEVIFIERRLLLREEIYITKQSSTRPFQQDVLVRREQVNIERLEPQDGEISDEM